MGRGLRELKELNVQIPKERVTSLEDSARQVSGVGIACSKKSKETSVARLERARGREVGSEIREVAGARS